MRHLSRAKRRRVWKRWVHAHSSCIRGLVSMWLWHGTHLMAPHAWRITRIAFPFVLARLSNPQPSGTLSRAIAPRGT